MSWVFVGLVVAIIAFYVLAPLRRFDDKAQAEEVEHSSDSSNIALNNTAIGGAVFDARVEAHEALPQLEMDRSLGKISDEEYKTLRAHLETHQASQQLSQDAFADVASSHKADSHNADDDLEVEAEILVARARLRRQRALQTVLESHNETDNAMNDVIKDAPSTWCCDCGRTMSNNDHFCASCGAPRVVATANV